MATYLPQNKFMDSAPARTSPGADDADASSSTPLSGAPAALSNPAMPTAGSAVLSDLPPVIGGTAAPFDEPSMTNGGAPEAPATVAPVRDTSAGATDFIHEIFHVARRLLKDDHRFVLDEAAFMAALDETPLFVREDDGHLRRNA